MKNNLLNLKNQKPIKYVTCRKIQAVCPASDRPPGEPVRWHTCPTLEPGLSRSYAAAKQRSVRSSESPGTPRGARWRQRWAESPGTKPGETWTSSALVASGKVKWRVSDLQRTLIHSKFRRNLRLKMNLNLKISSNFKKVTEVSPTRVGVKQNLVI